MAASHSAGGRAGDRRPREVAPCGFSPLIKVFKLALRAAGAGAGGRDRGGSGAFPIAHGDFLLSFAIALFERETERGEDLLPMLVGQLGLDPACPRGRPRARAPCRCQPPCVSLQACGVPFTQFPIGLEPSSTFPTPEEDVRSLLFRSTEIPTPLWLLPLSRSISPGFCLLIGSRRRLGEWRAFRRWSGAPLESGDVAQKSSLIDSAEWSRRVEHEERKCARTVYARGQQWRPTLLCGVSRKKIDALSLVASGLRSCSSRRRRRQDGRNLESGAAGMAHLLKFSLLRRGKE